MPVTHVSFGAKEMVSLPSLMPLLRRPLVHPLFPRQHHARLTQRLQLICDQAHSHQMYCRPAIRDMNAMTNG